MLTAYHKTFYGGRTGSGFASQASAPDSQMISLFRENFGTLNTMQIGDFFNCPDGAILKLERISDTDVCLFRDIELNVRFPLHRAVAEQQLRNSCHIADEQWKGLNDTLIEIAHDIQPQGEIWEVKAA